MKKIFILLFCGFSFVFLNAQKNSELSLDYLETQQNKSIENEDYEAAAKYKKAITLKTEIQAAVSDEDWDKAADLKSELNNINFKGNVKTTSNNDGYYSNNSGLKEYDDREILDGGFFIDGIFGAGTIGRNGYMLDPNVAVSFQMGTKWHFGNSRVYRPGLQMTWFRMGLQKAATTTYFSMHLYPVNIGYASMFAFSDELGLEVNVNFGLGLNFVLGDFPDEVGVQTGLHVNPNVKFRYNAFAVGFDISTLNGPFVDGSYVNTSDWFSTNVYSLTIGGKF